MPGLPLIVLLGAPHTGAQALALALQQRIAPQSARIIAATTAMPQAALTLLMGLDLPCPAEERPAQEAADTGLRAALDSAGHPYQVVYGLGGRRIGHALNAIKNIALRAYPSSAKADFDAQNTRPNARPRAWDCEKCSDPECEHRLFTTLVGQRDTGPG